MTSVQTDTSAVELVLTRMLDASPEDVFDAWLGRQIGEWIGPRGVSAKPMMLEPNVGGRYRIEMTTPDGRTPIVGGFYREIVRPTRLVFTWAWEHESQEMLITVTFRRLGKQTEMTLRQENFENAERRDSHQHGWTGSFDKLAEYLARRA